MKTLFLIPFLFVVNFSNAQTVDATRDLTLLKSLMNPSPKVDAEGSPYINEAFLPIKITLFKSKIFGARYNAYNGEMEVIIDKDESPIVLNKDNEPYEVTFTTLNKTYTYLEKTEKTDFFVIVNNLKNITLLKKEQVKFIAESKAKSSYQQGTPAKFKRLDDKYYIIINDKKAQIIPKKSKDLVKFFPESSKEILNYIKSNKIKISKENDLIKLTTYLNTL